MNGEFEYVLLKQTLILFFYFSIIYRLISLWESLLVKIWLSPKLVSWPGWYIQYIGVLIVGSTCFCWLCVVFCLWLACVREISSAWWGSRWLYVCVCVRDWTGNMMNNGTDVERARFLSLPLSALRSPFHRLFPSLLHFSFYSSTFTSVRHFSFSVGSFFPFHLISLSYLALPFMFSLFSLPSFSAGWCYRLNVPLLLELWSLDAK